MTTCTKCVMSTQDDPKIVFDQQGICNHCISYDLNIKKHYFGDEENLTSFFSLIDSIKAASKNKKYDVLIGLSGGVDSTFVAHLCAKHGLRALAVHLDNGWNSELSVVNIKHILKYTQFDLYTYVINWNEFRDLQKSYFKANVVDIEALTDHAIISVLLTTAVENHISFILTGSSITTEGRLPSNWVHNKGDSLNIKDIHKRFGSVKIKTYPLLGWLKRTYLLKTKKVRMIDILDYYPYNKPLAKQIITEEFKWRDYGGKHYESVFTRFYQAYILPRKFNIDKRKSHYSTLICAGQLTRKEALELLKMPTYEDSALEKSDVQFVKKKLGFTNEEFQEYMMSSRVEHTKYRSVENVFNKLRRIKRIIKFWK